MIPALSALTALTIPSPSEGVWHLGPLPIRAYALCIIAGIIVAIIVSERRWVARGGKYGEIQDLALWAVPFGLVGGRLYHVATDYELYFGDDKNPVTALYVWRGGLGIWGAIALGAVGVWIGARRKGIKVLPVMDAMAPGAVLAQAIGRWGNYFNQELYGRTTDLPWKLEITKDANGDPVPATYHHPTFLYEFIWDLGVFGLLVWADRRFKLGFGRVVALYIVGYTFGRAWIEDLRVDKVQLNDVLGLRLNVWTSIVLFVIGAVWFVWSARRHPGRESSVYVDKGIDDMDKDLDKDLDKDEEKAVDTDVDDDIASDPDRGDRTGSEDVTLDKTAAAKTSVAKTSVAKTGVAKTGVAKTGAAKTSVAKTAAAKTGVAKTAAAKTAAAETAAAKKAAKTAAAKTAAAKTAAAKTAAAKTAEDKTAEDKTSEDKT